ncbi:MAG: hypothetical protein SGILL_003951 [Bacillariaceae sp.]
MKFLVSKTFLAVLVLGAAAATDAKKNDVAERNMEDFAYWRDLVYVQGLASVPTDAPVAPTDAPVAPVAPPSDAPVSPTDAPVAPVATPTDAPVAPVATPTDAPVAPVTSPTDAPVTPTEAPVAPVATPTDAPVAPTEAPVAPTIPPTGGTPTVQMRLTPFTLQGGAEFNDPESYQSQALLRTEQQEGVDAFTDEKLTQYYALYSIYNATNQVPNIITDDDPRFDGIPFPRWLVETGWDQTNVDPCDGWFGIACDAEGRVETIDLFENLLTGAFPPEVALLSLDGPDATGGGNLFRLDLFRNEFLYNNDDSSWFTDLGSNMETLIVEETSFAGDIPRLPPNLVNFDISFAFYTGGLTDASFSGIDSLNFIDLDGNAFNTTVPQVFGSLPNLQFLYLSDSFISGDLSYMQGMQSMREHWIDTNPGLTGPIFDYIGDITTLESFSITFSSLTGTIPTTLGQLSTMLQMWLYSNQLTGPIPTELGNLRTMAILQLEGNMLTGEMPAEVCANTMFPLQVLQVLGADCEDPGFTCSCCTCCSLVECNT